MRAAMIWNQPVSNELKAGAHIGTTCLHVLTGIDALWWEPGQAAPDAVAAYDVLIVNLFSNMDHVTEIRRVHPNAKIVGLPDEYFGITFSVIRGRESDGGRNMFEQLAASDAIGYISLSNLYFYRGLFPDKPMHRVPMPIGDEAFFEIVRQRPKKDYLLAVDHGERVVDWTIQNVAACTLVQQRTGIEVIYVNPGRHTEMYADMLGLRATFLNYLPYNKFCELAAEARIGMDLYALHGYGRNELTFAYCGTPIIGGDYTEMIAVEKTGPFEPSVAADRAVQLLTNPGLYNQARNDALEEAQRGNSFEYCADRMERLLEKVYHAKN